MLDLSCTYYQLSNAPSLVPVLKAVLHNFTKQLNQVWWYSLDPVVTSLQPQLSPNPDDKIFLRSDLSSTHHWLSNAPSLVSVRRITIENSQNVVCLRSTVSHVARWRHFHRTFASSKCKKNFFEVRFVIYTSLAFQRVIARLCTSNRTPNIQKHYSVVYTHFLHRPRLWRHSPQAPTSSRCKESFRLELELSHD